MESYDGEEARGEAGDQVFSGPSADDGVVSPRHSGTVVRRHHQAHLDELAGVTGQPEKHHHGWFSFIFYYFSCDI